KPSFTLTYGLGWTLEMPPTEKHGKQIELVDSSGQQLDTLSYINQREAAALKGDVYNPEIGFALVGNTGKGQKYPYEPFYGFLSPPSRALTTSHRVPAKPWTHISGPT